MNQDEVRFRLLRNNDVPPTNPFGLAYRFGLQNTTGNLIAGTQETDGTISFDFSLKVKQEREGEQPVFTGSFASGPREDRFVYLSWRAAESGKWINRIKARLASIDWTMVRDSQEQNRPITADLSGWSPGDTRKFVAWYLG
ncbi:DUF5990 family protein [Acidicapsa dinghuensis]|uniref:DUF5990 family protein n=1 Tax=Acidicapsa dinghuensis TaxID=2218256 RepID=A0ABW1EEH5_9BACT|nr:DUF5990 family protein [Acidicapsa dinghuensis]